jgi:hypothetical protein
MTEWDHGHDGGPDHDPGVEPSWETLGPEPAHLDEPTGPGDPYGSTSDPEPDLRAGPEPASEPAGLPAEPPADWSAPDHPSDLAAWSPEHPADLGAGDPDHPGDPADPDGDGGVLHAADPAGWDQHDAFGPADPESGPDDTDPAGWTAAAGADPFPPVLDVDVEPADGGPWTDPDLLGGPDRWTAGPDHEAPADPPAALLPDLAAADGDPDAGWDALRDSDDPAVRALTRHWNP